MPKRYYRNRRTVLGRARQNPPENYVRALNWSTNTNSGLLRTWLPTTVLKDWLIHHLSGPAYDTVLKVAAPQQSVQSGQLVLTLHSGDPPPDGLNVYIPPGVREAVGSGGELFAAGVIRLSVTATVTTDETALPLEEDLAEPRTAGTADDPRRSPRSEPQPDRPMAHEAKRSVMPSRGRAKRK